MIRARTRRLHARMRTWLSAWQPGRFVVPVLTLVTGVVAAQAIVFAARPVLTRLFTPEEFGVLTLFVTLTTPLAVGAFGRYEDTTMLPSSERAAANLFVLSSLVGGLTFLALTPVMLGRVWLANLLNSPEIEVGLLLLPLTVVLVAGGRLLETWHTRFDRFRLVSVGRSVQSGVVVAIQIATGVLGVGAIGLVAGAVAGFGAVVVLLAVVVIVRDGRLFRSSVSPRRMRVLGRRYRRFPLLAAPAAFLNTLSGRAVIPLLAVFFGATPVGLYGIAAGTLALPVGLVTGAVGQVFFVRAAEAHRDEALGPLANSVFRRLVAVALFPMAAAAVAGPELFAFVFGAPWREAGVFARLLAPWLLFSVIAVPLTRIFDVTERQRDDFGFSLFLFATQVVVIALASQSSDVRVTIAAVSFAGAASRVLQIGWMLRLAGASLSRSVFAFAGHAALAVPFLGLVVLAQRSTPLVLLLATLVAGLGYVGTAALLDRRAVRAASAS